MTIKRDLPLVSCIMPTKDRRPFARRAIELFQRQDYPNRELVIVDDGKDRIADLVGGDDRIRYVPLDRRLTLGAKRNLACQHARGSLIAHWDDDDWHAPRRLSYQVTGMLDTGADLAGTDRLLFYDRRRRQAFEYVFRPGPRRWLAGGTLIYRREWWRTHPFANLEIGEDGTFVHAARSGRLMTLRDPTFYVALIHDRNTSPKHTSGSNWRPYPERELESIIGDDWWWFASGADGDDGWARPVAAGDPRVTVSIPFHGTRDLVVRAVESILGQTYANLRLIVMNDGDPTPPWDLLRDIDDPRLVRFDLPVNRGRYFADAIVIEATPDALHLVQDSDDWSEPDRLEALLAEMRGSDAVGIVSAGYDHDEDGHGSVQQGSHFPARGRALTPDNDHRLNHVGLFSVPALRAIGGYFGGERIGYDTLIGNLLLMIGEIGYVDRPLYHRLFRNGSLTLNPETGMGTPLREAVGRSLYEVYREAYGQYEARQAGTISRHELARRIRTIVEGRVGADDRAAIRAAAGRLRALLLEQDERWAADPDAFVPRRADSPTCASTPASAGRRARPPSVEDRRFEWNAWTVTPALAGSLADRLQATKPARLLELGSGISTVILAGHAARTGATVVTLEHDAGYHERTSRLLTAFGLRDHVDLRLAPLRPRVCADGGTYPFYDSALTGAFDFVLVDGPPMRDGRQAALFALSGHLAPGWELWLDDGRRDHERHCLELWRSHFSFEAGLHDVDFKGLWILHGADRPEGGERPAARRREVPALGRPAGSGVAIRPSATDVHPPASSTPPASMPLVSCVMPTFDRRAFVPRAIELFERQDYPERELLIVDDGQDAVRDLIPDDPRYRYLRLDRRASIGAKRNIACEAAAGDIVIGWDDDDWYAPHRIRVQTEALRLGRADAVGLTQAVMFDVTTGRYWQCDGALQQRMFASGVVSGTLAFLRSYWQQGERYPDVSLAEDASFQKGLVARGARLERLAGGDLFIYVRHGRNSWRFTAGAYGDPRGWRAILQPDFLTPDDVMAFRSIRAVPHLSHRPPRALLVRA
jgi:glycosyltransferase involved in cell wall biosynthesis